jgi:hypothetical protein
MEATITKYDLYPIENPTSYCIGFTLNGQFIDTIVEIENGNDDEEYYINKAYEKVKDILQTFITKKNIIGRKIKVPSLNEENIKEKKRNKNSNNSLLSKVEVNTPILNNNISDKSEDKRNLRNNSLYSNDTKVINNILSDKIKTPTRIESNKIINNKEISLDSNILCSNDIKSVLMDKIKTSTRIEKTILESNKLEDLENSKELSLENNSNDIISKFKKIR